MGGEGIGRGEGGGGEGVGGGKVGGEGGGGGGEVNHHGGGGEGGGGRPGESGGPAGGKGGGLGAEAPGGRVPLRHGKLDSSSPISMLDRKYTTAPRASKMANDTIAYPSESRYKTGRQSPELTIISKPWDGRSVMLMGG